MPVGWCESIPFDRLRKWKSNVSESLHSCVTIPLAKLRKWRGNVSEASPHLWPVFISMVLTQIAWVVVYQCRDKNNIIKMARCVVARQCSARSRISNNSIHDFDFSDTNPKTIEEYIIESLQLVAILVPCSFISFVLAWIASKFEKGQERLCALGALYTAFICSGTVVMDSTNLLNIDVSFKQLIAGLCTFGYVFGALVAFCTNVFPARIFQYYAVSTCVFLSVYMLIFLPGGSFWTITTGLFFFLGLTCCISARVGKSPDHDLDKPLRIETKEMDAHIRRYVIYEIKAPDGYALGQIEKTPRSSKYYVEAGEIFYGEFVVYAILVGQSMASGIIPCIVSACGVLIGVVCSVNVRSRNRIVCSLPYSILFGFCGHFGTLIVQYAVIFLSKTTA